MKKSLFLALFATLIQGAALASVVKGYDTEKGCDLYRVIQAETNGNYKPGVGEVIIYSKEVYGLSFQDMEINFDAREVLVQPTMNIIMGANRPLTATKSIISSDHQDFNFLINQLNRKIYVFEKICIGEGKIVYAKMFESENK